MYQMQNPGQKKNRASGNAWLFLAYLGYIAGPGRTPYIPRPSHSNFLFFILYNLDYRGSKTGIKQLLKISQKARHSGSHL